MATLTKTDFHLTEHCNFACKGCGHFCPIAEPEFADLDQYKKDMKRLSELFTHIYFLNLMGGEPLLHPGICDFIKVARESFPNSIISVVTNGILLQKMPELFWTTLKECSSGVIVSLYPPLEPLIAERIFLAASYDVNIKFLSLTTFRGGLNLKGDNDKIAVFNKCKVIERCHFLKKGTMSVCGMPHHFEHFNKKFDEHLPQDGIFDIHDPELTGDKIVEIFDTAIEGCRYCNPFSRSFEWGVSTKEKSEWCL